MDSKNTICLLNDSFPPQIDGVANVVTNYAKIMASNGQKPVVIVPDHPEAKDSAFPYPVIRYPSIDLRKKTGYMGGIPFSPEIVKSLSGQEISLLHTHCPIVSAMIGRELRQIYDAPLVLTYHTKFDIDIANILKSKALRAGSQHALVENINACDEVWAVSQGAIDNLRSLGYEGNCLVMPNGVDIPKGRVSKAEIADVTEGFDLPGGVPIFLFVGRMMWYKGLKIIIEALAKLKAAGDPFRMVFIGSGADAEEVTAYAEAVGIRDSCIFTGAIHDRNTLRAWYCRADLFLFPSTFDTNGLVVREAAACGLGSVLIRGSCAAEGVIDERNGLLIDENADSLFSCLHKLAGNREYMAQIGQAASDDLYLSWEDAVRLATARYEIILDRHKSGFYPTRFTPIEEVMKANGALMEDLAHLQQTREGIRAHLRESIRAHLEDYPMKHHHIPLRKHFQDLNEHNLH